MDTSTTTQVKGLYRALKEIAAATSNDLTIRQLLVLLSVGGSTSPMTQQQLVEQADAYKSTMSKIVAALAGNAGDVRRADGLGLLQVDLDPSDLRSRLVSLTKEGDRVLSRACKAMSK